jgi:hypothetical protein
LRHAWTDNCGGQYEYKQKFYKVTTFGDRNERDTLQHRFAQKYCFKGVWDGAGKVVKAFIRESKVSVKERFLDAVTCLINFKDAPMFPKNRTDWEQFEADLDPKILGIEFHYL